MSNYNILQQMNFYDYDKRQNVGFSMKSNAKGNLLKSFQPGGWVSNTNLYMYRLF